MPDPHSPIPVIRREAVLLASLFAFGLLLLPLLVFLVGRVVFGDYEGDGLGGFWSAFGSRLLAGETSAWFLVLSPFIVVSLLRLIALGWRLAGTRKT